MQFFLCCVKMATRRLILGVLVAFAFVVGACRGDCVDDSEYGESGIKTDHGCWASMKYFNNLR